MNNDALKISNLYDLNETIAAKVFEDCTYPWEVLAKIGAFLGDNVEVGCGSVLNPGTIVGRESNIYPLSSVRGFIPAGSIYKKQGEVVTKR